jgi:glycosyltransferase 2 family protein
VLVVLVVAAVGRYVAKLVGRAAAEGVELQAGWLVLAGALYAVGMSLCGTFWRRCMAEMGDVRLPLLRALGAYWCSQLGKYVPGKAWVIVIRASLAGTGGRLVPAATTYFETLFMMAVGALVSLVCFAVAWTPRRAEVLGASAGLMVFLFLVVSPSVFRRATRLMGLPLGEEGRREVRACRGRTLLGGGARIALGWGLLGASCAAAVRGVGAGPLTVELWPLLIGATALATVGGFVALIIPGGLGVRELLLIEAVGPVIGHERAAAAALAVRLAWVLTEITMAMGTLGWLKLAGRSEKRGTAGETPRAPS